MPLNYLTCEKNGAIEMQHNNNNKNLYQQFPAKYLNWPHIFIRPLLQYCPSICKLFDIILMKKCSDVLCTSDQQFAFKANHSTTLCTGILMETATHFVNNNSCVYSCFLDASKAFDKVHYGKLFNLMLKRGVPSVIVRFILDGYIRHRMCAQWERHTSRSFHVCNGVKQGAVISPILFAVYCRSAYCL